MSTHEDAKDFSHSRSSKSITNKSGIILRQSRDLYPYKDHMIEKIPEELVG